MIRKEVLLCPAAEHSVPVGGSPNYSMASGPAPQGRQARGAEATRQPKAPHLESGDRECPAQVLAHLREFRYCPSKTGRLVKACAVLQSRGTAQSPEDEMVSSPSAD
ncbi:hypothetical protein GCM10023096_82540 [Nonomuraea ferruginea]